MFRASYNTFLELQGLHLVQDLPREINQVIEKARLGFEPVAQPWKASWKLFASDRRWAKLVCPYRSRVR
jgi:hypothetical protein